MINFTQQNNTYSNGEIGQKEQFILQAETIIRMSKDEIMEDLRKGNSSVVKNTILGLHDYECNDFGINTMVGRSIFLDAGIETETIEINDRPKTYNVLIDNNENKLKEYLQEQINKCLRDKAE